MSILFTSAGRRVELLAAFQKAVRSLNLKDRIIAVDTDPLAPALHEADCRYIVPPLISDKYISSLLEICEREKVRLVFPLIDPDIPILSANKSQFDNIGTRVVVVSPEAVETTADKWLTTSFFQKLGLPTARSWLPNKTGDRSLEFPLYIKPRRGSAGRDGFRIANENELTFFSNYVRDPIIQEYLPGPEITSDVMCDLDGKLLGVVSRQRLEVRGGEVTKGVTVLDERIIDACVRIAQFLPALGPITVQCIMKDGVPHFTEINARFGGGVPLGIAAGVDSPRWFLAQATGLHIPMPPIGSYKVGLYLTRCDHSFFLESSDLACSPSDPSRP